MGKKAKRIQKPTTIFFLRHGQPENPRKLIKGTASFPLFEEGQEQVKVQAKKLKGERIAAIFTSPALRCRQTAWIAASVLNEDLPGVKTPRKPCRWRGRVSGCSEAEAMTPPRWNISGPGGVKIKQTTHLSEWTSEYDGQPAAVMADFSLEEYNRAFQPKMTVLKRMKDFVRMALAKYPGQRIVAVSHQGPIDLLLFSLQGKDTANLPREGLITKMGELIKVILSQDMKILEIERISY